MNPGDLLRDARVRHRVSQQELARRAQTTQSAISRIEREHVSPTVGTLRDLLHLLGEDLVLEVEPREAPRSSESRDATNASHPATT